MKNICKFIGAGGDKPQKFSKTKTADFFIPVISNGIENDGIFGYTKIPTITETSITISARGTIGFCQIRNEPYMPIVRLISVIPFETVDIKYLYVVFNALLEKGEGTSTPQLTIPFLKDKLIPIPSIKTQQSISNIIESANNLINKISKDYREQVLYSNFCKSKILESIFSKESSYKSYYENPLKIGDILKYEQPGPYIVKSTQYNDDFTTPVLTPGKTFILGYTNENFGIYHANGDNRVIIFDDFTTSSRIIDFDFKVKSSAMKILKISDSEKYDIEYMYYLLQTIHINNDSHKRFWISEYMPYETKIHTASEQKAIVKRIKGAFAILDKIK